MYLSIDIITKSIEYLKRVHPFFGITFLALKTKELSIGIANSHSVSSYEKEILEKYFTPEESKWYFTPFKSSGKDKYWIKKDYPGKGAQKTRTTQFKDAFIHETDTQSWGWQEDYVDTLKKLIDRYQNGHSIPLKPLIIFLYRNEAWKKDITLEDIVQKFISDFYISVPEREKLFEEFTLSEEEPDDLLQDSPCHWDIIRDRLNIPPPPDAPSKRGYSLSLIQFDNFSPFDHIKADISPRLNIFTGDNGLGKTLLLEAAWWGLSGQWTSDYSTSFVLKSSFPSIKFGVTLGNKAEFFKLRYDHTNSGWQLEKGKQFIESGLVLYQRVDGVVSVFDSSRKQFQALTFNNQQLWDGYSILQSGKPIHICNGLIQDWTFWQTSDKDSFQVFKDILKLLSPPGIEEGDLGILEPGSLIRILGDSRLIPTIKHAYGEVPVTVTSAAVKRVLSIAYLIYWSWKEHQEQSRLNNIIPHKQLIILIDEIEAHLHPKWQRLLLPAILKVVKMLSKDIDIQLLITTHSPLVMASVEPFFEPNIDNLFHFDLEHGKSIGNIILKRLDFYKRGSANEWLKSESFEITQPVNVEAEMAMIEAIKLMQADSPSGKSIESIHKKLINVLAPHDPFWVRWNYFAKQNRITD